MWRLPFRQSRPKATSFIPRLLVVTQDYDHALALSNLVEREGCLVSFVIADEIAKAEGMEPMPHGVLVAPEVSTPDKEAVCQFLRGLDAYEGLPLLAVATLAEGKAHIPADRVVRPPETLRDAIHQLRELVLERSGKQS